MKQKPLTVNHSILLVFLFQLSIFLFACKTFSTETPFLSALPAEIPGNAETYLARGDFYADAQHWQEAIIQYDLALSLAPDFAEAYNNRGYAYYWSGDAAHAIADYTRAIELRPNYPYAYNNRGAAYLASGHPEQAISDFDQAIRLQPDFPQAYTNRGNTYLRLGRLGMAMADFRRAASNPLGSILYCVVMLVIVFLIGLVLRRLFFLIRRVQ